jgi:hypothetical protein
MEGANAPDQFIRAGLAAMGIEVDEIDLAVIAATHEVFWPAILDLLSLDTADLEPELFPDLSQAP